MKDTDTERYSRDAETGLYSRTQYLKLLGIGSVALIAGCAGGGPNAVMPSRRPNVFQVGGVDGGGGTSGGGSANVTYNVSQSGTQMSIVDSNGDTVLTADMSGGGINTGPYLIPKSSLAANSWSGAGGTLSSNSGQPTFSNPNVVATVTTSVNTASNTTTFTLSRTALGGTVIGRNGNPLTASQQSQCNIDMENETAAALAVAAAAVALGVPGVDIFAAIGLAGLLVALKATMDQANQDNCPAG